MLSRPMCCPIPLSPHHLPDGDLWYRHDANSTLLDICREGFRLAMPTVRITTLHVAQCHYCVVLDIDTHHTMYHKHHYKQRVHHPRAHMRVQHRVGVFDIVPGEQDTPDGRIPRWRITNVLSQSDVLRLLVHHAPQLDPYFHNTLQELGLVGVAA